MADRSELYNGITLMRAIPRCSRRISINTSRVCVMRARNTVRALSFRRQRIGAARTCSKSAPRGAFTRAKVLSTYGEKGGAGREREAFASDCIIAAVETARAISGNLLYGLPDERWDSNGRKSNARRCVISLARPYVIQFSFFTSPAGDNIIRATRSP